MGFYSFMFVAWCVLTVPLWEAFSVILFFVMVAIAEIVILANYFAGKMENLRQQLEDPNYEIGEEYIQHMFDYMYTYIKAEELTATSTETMWNELSVGEKDGKK